MFGIVLLGWLFIKVAAKDGLTESLLVDYLFGFVLGEQVSGAKC